MTNSIDPVCKMTVTDEKETERYAYNGQTYYFCSNACKQMFVKDPENYQKTKKK